MVMYNGKVWGTQVSHYGLEKGYLDYKALAGIVEDMILNNTLMTLDEFSYDWELFCGEDQYGVDSKGNKCEPYDDDCCEVFVYDVYQHYIISENGALFLSEHTDEIVYYNSTLDLYVWGITHFGTSWDYVLTDIKLVDGDKQ